ncbi:MAG: DUF1583 domain-containing protein [Planctomycetaceae bacterium]
MKRPAKAKAMRYCCNLLLLTLLIDTQDVLANGAVRSGTATWLLFDEAVLAENVAAVRQRASRMSDEDRLGFLERWVLPSETHPSVRAVGEFCSPAAAVSADVEDRPSAFPRQVQSPVGDLIQTARRLGKLSELRSRVAELIGFGDRKLSIAEAAVLILLDVELHGLADEDLYLILEQRQRNFPSFRPADVWPALLVIDDAVHRELSTGEPMPAVVSDLLAVLQRRPLPDRLTASESLLRAHVNGLWNRHAAFQQTGEYREDESAKAGGLWVSASGASAMSNGLGYPVSHWSWNGQEGHLMSGQGREYLFLSSPLWGEYDIEADLDPQARTQLMAAGECYGMSTNLSGIQAGRMRSSLKVIPVKPPLAKTGQWAHGRIRIRDGIRTLFVNGRALMETPISEGDSPWVGLRGWCLSDAPFRNVRISGSPIIPKEVPLSVHPDLPGWESHFGQGLGGPTDVWRFQPVEGEPAQIQADVQPALKGTFCESLLQYRRPVPRHGQVRYEFFYEPGVRLVHPALDHMAMILTPNGVNGHPITDGSYESDNRSPSVQVTEPEARRGLSPLPLKPGQWNSVEVSLAETNLQLRLNDQLVFERSIHEKDHRRFGLFRFADRDEVRVRNVVLSGDWPTVLPELSAQLFSDPFELQLDIERETPFTVYHHDFATGGLPPGDFLSLPLRNAGVNPQPDGLHFSILSTGRWAQADLTSAMLLRGDCDVLLRMNQVQMDGPKINGAGVIVSIGNVCELQMYRRGDGQNQRVTVGWREAGSDGEFRISYDHIESEAPSGTFRISRRGETMTLLFAENDSTVFQHVGQREIPGCDEHDIEVRLRVIVSEGGSTTAVWKSLTLSAEQIFQQPDPDALSIPVLMTMNVDGSDLKAITKPIPGVPGQGSPDWSPDGKWIVFDGWQGTAEKTHMYRVTSDGDGSEVRDLGFGTMPTYAPDGRTLAFTWGGHGMAIMDPDGENREVISSDGWGAQYSPDGKFLAYQTYERSGDGEVRINITVIDIATRQERVLLAGMAASRYSQIFWNMEWSPDGRFICFKGNTKTGETEMAVVSTEGVSEEVKVLATGNVHPDFSWHPTQNRILLARRSNRHGGTRLHICDPDSGDITLLETQPLNSENISGVWSPDGRKIVFVSQPRPEPIPWHPSD